MSAECSQLLTTRRIQDEYEINPKEIRAAAKRQEVTGVKRGRKLYVERSDLERWIRTPKPGKEVGHGV